MCATIAEQLVVEFGQKDVFQTKISENVSLAESPWLNMDVFEHAPTSRGANNYEALLGELLGAGLVN